MTGPLARPKYIGQPVQRLEDPRLLTGTGRYAADHAAPRMLHLAFVRADQAHARIVAVDTAEAAAMPGVVAVFTGADFATLPPITAPSRMKAYRPTRMPVMPADRVHHAGEPVAVVVASDRYLAEDAAAAVAVTLEPLPAAADAGAAAEPGAPVLHADMPDNIALARTFATGDAPAALAAAPHRVSGRFRMHRKAPMALEPRAWLAEYDAGRDALTLTGTTQVPGVVRDAIAATLGLPGSRLRVVAPDVGGGFGGKGSVYREEIVVAALARRLARPVKWVADRLEDMLSTAQAFDETVTAELGFDADGTLIALDADVLGDVGAWSIHPWTAALEPVQVASFLPGPYRIAQYRGRVRGVYTPKPPTGPYRGVGRPMAVFVLERLIDRAAAVLGLDPAEIRRRNLVPPDGFPHRIGSGLIWDRSGFRECLDAACAAADYPALRAEQAAARAQGRLMGIGLASYAELTGIGSRISVAPGMPLNTGSETATVRIDATGAVTATFAVAAHGQSLETTLAQIVAEELGVTPEAVRVVQGDTGAVTHGTGTYASRSAVIGGGAAIGAARGLRTIVARVAARLFDVAPEAVEIAEGRITVPGTNHGIGFDDLARAVYADMSTLPVEAREGLEARAVFDPVLGTTTAATHLAVVEVDPDTCKVHLRRLVVAEDCGRIINPLVVDGQVQGGVAQGIGAALYEDLRYDGAGQLLAATLADYLVPTAAEVPPMTIAHVETVLPDNPGGFRGMGEGGTIGAPAAIANAIADALAPLGRGDRIDTLPMTPERLFQRLHGA